MSVNLRLLDLLLSRLPELPVVDQDEVAALGGWVAAIDHRSENLDILYACALCGSRRFVHAITVQPRHLSDPQERWLDLCPPCRHAVGDLVTNWPGDDFVLSRLGQLQAETARQA